MHSLGPHFGLRCVEMWHYWRQCNLKVQTATSRPFLPIKRGGMWHLLEHQSHQVSDICGALPTHHLLPPGEGPVELGRVIALSRPHSAALDSDLRGRGRVHKESEAVSR